MTPGALVCFLVASRFGADAMTLVAKEENKKVAVGADALQQVMRNVNHEDPIAKAVAINLYYETRCPDCVEFINQTLRPLWNNKDIRPHLNITMNPYGNAMSIPVAKVSEGYKAAMNYDGEGNEENVQQEPEAEDQPEPEEEEV